MGSKGKYTNYMWNSTWNSACYCVVLDQSMDNQRVKQLIMGNFVMVHIHVSLILQCYFFQDAQLFRNIWKLHCTFFCMCGLLGVHMHKILLTKWCLYYTYLSRVCTNLEDPWIWKSKFNTLNVFVHGFLEEPCNVLFTCFHVMEEQI